MATVTVRRKPTYAELEAKVKELQDALVIAERNRCLRDVGWDMLHNQIKERDIQIRGLQAQNEKADRLIEELNDEITAGEREIAALVEEKQVLREQVEDLTKRVAELKGCLAQKDKINDTAANAAIELAEMMVKANTERDEAKVEAESLKLEIQEREFRIDELEKQVDWLQGKNEEWAQVAANLNGEAERWKRIASDNVEMAKDFHLEATAAEEKFDGMKKSYDELYERSADNHANAQYWEEQALKMEGELDESRRQLKANEESYLALKAAYDELFGAVSGVARLIRTNTFAN